MSISVQLDGSLMQSRTTPPWWAAALVCIALLASAWFIWEDLHDDVAQPYDIAQQYDVGACSSSFASWIGDETFATRILGMIRASFATLHLAVFVYLLTETTHHHFAYADDLGSSLEREAATMRGPVRLYSYFTIWTYTAQGLYFGLASWCTYRLLSGRLCDFASLWMTEALFQVTCSAGLLVTLVVTFIFRSSRQSCADLLMHNVNALEIATELLLGRTPIVMAHSPLSVLWGLAFIAASWLNAPRLAALAKLDGANNISHGNGGNFVYFFLDWTLPAKTFLSCKLLLLAVLLIAYLASLGVRALSQSCSESGVPFLLQTGAAYGFVFLITTWRTPEELHRYWQRT